MKKRGIGLILDLPSPEELRKKRFRKGGGDMPMGGGEEPEEEAEDDAPDARLSLMGEFIDAVKDGDAEAACGFLEEYVKQYT